MKLIISLNMSQAEFIHNAIKRYQKCTGIKLNRSDIINWLMVNGFQGVINELSHLEANVQPKINPFKEQGLSLPIPKINGKPKFTLIKGGFYGTNRP